MISRLTSIFVSTFTPMVFFLEPIQFTVQAQAIKSGLTPAEARVIAKEAYIYGFPLVDNYRVLHSYFVDRDGREFKAP